MVLPALQVRVPNPANALLQAEQIKGARAATAERARQGEVRNQLLQAFQGGIPTDPTAQNALVNTIAGIDPQTALGLRQAFQPPAGTQALSPDRFRQEVELRNQRNAPPGTSAMQNFAFLQQLAAADPALAESFSTFLQNNKGGVTTNVNFPDAIALTTGTATEAQKSVLDAQASLARLDTIAAGFKPEFLTLRTQAGVEIDAFRERVLEPFGVAGLDPEERARLSEYATFQRDTINNLSLFVQSLSGAAVTPQEAERLGKSVPEMGDAPTEFQSKMNASIRDNRRAIARYNFALRNGLDPLDSGIALDGIDALIDQTGQQLLDQLMAGGMSREDALPMVAEELKRQFGL